jgi:hypothetical protein
MPGPRYTTKDHQNGAPARPRLILSAMAILVTMGFAAGCSGDDTTPGAGSGGTGGTAGAAGAGGASDHDARDGNFVTCARPNDPVDSYRANLSKAGSDGKLTFTLVKSDNAPPVRGSNTWTLKILRADQTTMTGEVVPDVKMPLHTHPAGLQPQITFDAGEGVYVATPLHFFMPGYWSSEFSAYEGAATGNDPVDRGTFYFCIE